MDEIGQDFQLPTCPRLFNIFHPFDPVVSSTDYNSSLLVEQFSIECQKSKTKVITATNQSKGENRRKPMRTRREIRQSALKRGKIQAT